MKKLLVLLMGILISAIAFAHAPIISVDDNGDGSIYIEGGFSNGASAEGVEIIVVKDKAYNGPEETFKGKEVLYKGKLASDNSLTLPKPITDKYEVYFNAGEGHVIGKKGPALTEEEKEKWNKLIETYDFGDWKELMLEE